MEEKIMISKDTSLERDGVWVNGIKITTSEDWNRVVEESIPKQVIRGKINTLEMEEHYDYIDNSKAISVLKELLRE